MTTINTINAKIIHSVGDNCTVTISPERKELDALLGQALKQIQSDSEMHRAIVSLQSDLKATGAPAVASTNYFLRALEALPHADKVVGVGHKVVGILDKLGHLPS